MKKHLFQTAAVLFVFGLSFSAWAQLKLSAECTKDDALFKTGEKITFRVMLKKADGSPESGQKLSYTLKGDGGLLKSGEIVSAEEPQELTTQLDRPGFVLLTVTTKDGKKTLKTWAGAGVEPEKIQPGTPDTPDFDEFWAENLKALRSREIKSEVEPVADPKIRSGVNVYKVQLDNGEIRANGYLLVPADAKPGSLPIIAMFNGASTIGGFYASLDNMTAAYRALVFNMNLHDIPADIPRSEWGKWRKSEEIRDYMYRDTSDPRKYRIFKIFMRVALTLEYLKSRPEWNQKTIITRGGSLGGAQSLTAAYFEPKVVLCVANAPALCDHFGADRRQSPGWPNLFVRLKNKPEELAAARKAMRYFDMVNFAKRIKCRVAMSTGFIDTICPPTSDYAVYNSLSCEKSIVNVVLGMHGISLKKGESSVFAVNGPLVARECAKVRKGK